MRTCQVDRRKRTRCLIELGGLVIKSGIVELTNDDRAVIYGALLWAAGRLRSEERERAMDLLAKRGRNAFDNDAQTLDRTKSSDLLAGERQTKPSAS